MQQISVLLATFSGFFFSFQVSMLFTTADASTRVYSRIVEPFLSCMDTPALTEVLLGARMGQFNKC